MEPLTLRYEPAPPVEPARPVAVVVFFFLVCLAGPVIGAITNWINGSVSSQYFCSVMGWWREPDVRSLAVQQGVFEGAIVGLAAAVALTVLVAAITRVRCSLRDGLVWALVICIVDLIAWSLGGAVGLLIAACSPATFRTIVSQGYPPDEPAGLRRFAWVGGSIWGGEIAGPVLVLIVMILLLVRWQKIHAMRLLAKSAPRSVA
jgi:hypothetical protein